MKKSYWIIYLDSVGDNDEAFYAAEMVTAKSPSEAVAKMEWRPETDQTVLVFDVNDGKPFDINPILSIKEGKDRKI